MCGVRDRDRLPGRAAWWPRPVPLKRAAGGGAQTAARRTARLCLWSASSLVAILLPLFFLLFSVSVNTQSAHVAHLLTSQPKPVSSHNCVTNRHADYREGDRKRRGKVVLFSRVFFRQPCVVFLVPAFSFASNPPPPLLFRDLAAPKKSDNFCYCYATNTTNAQNISPTPRHQRHDITGE